MAKFRVTFQFDGKAEVEQLHLEVAGAVVSCDDILRALGAHLKPSEFWPFVVATDALADDADLAERAVRLHRVKAACRYLNLASLSYLLEGRDMEIHC